MSTKDDEFLEQLRATFKIEANEHLQTISSGLLELEKTQASDAQREIVETVFRAAHSLKGAARTVDFSRVEALCQSLEDAFAAWKREGGAPSPDALDALHGVLDAIAAALAARVDSRATRPQPGLSSLRRSVRQVEPSAPRFPSSEPPSAPPAGMGPGAAETPRVEAAVPAAPIATEKTASDETVRIAVSKLEARLLESEEMLTAKLTASQRVADLHELAGRFEAWGKAWRAIEPDVRELRESNDRPTGRRNTPGLRRVLEFFDSGLETLKSMEIRAAAFGQAAEQDRSVVAKLVDDLLEDSKKLLLLPFATISGALPKLVRDQCRDQGKEADLTIRGDDVEIDKRILEDMKDPLIHLLRNSVDHGIESPAERTRRGKPARATITVAVSQINASKVQLMVADDGAGIDIAKVKASAVSHGLISTDEARRLGEDDAPSLIFQSEVSTSPIITQLSGRGLGLAIVREKAEKLGGEVSVESRPGAGTTFRITVPAMRATFRGILVQAAGRLAVVPTAQVERVTRVRPGDVKTVEGRQTISLDGRAVALVQLAEALELPPAERNETPAGGVPVIIVGTGDHRVAFAIDAVIGEQEVLVKPLRKPLSRVRNVAAATVLGSGQVAPILNVGDLLKSARRHARAPLRARTETPAMQTESRRVLIAEDSITSRMLLKGILESAGYSVKTAVDGMEAFTLLRTEPFDLVVSDVEMPRLNGFDLTARVRADPHLAQMPVVLVTALASREDRERGVDAGANAYLVKSSFDQSDLLETVRRLI